MTYNMACYEMHEFTNGAVTLKGTDTFVRFIVNGENIALWKETTGRIAWYSTEWKKKYEDWKATR